MDTSAGDITFNDAGVCSYCREFSERAGHILDEDTQAREARLRNLVDAIKRSGKDKAYDCVVGVSGGADSSWALVQAVKLGLRPLAVHMDNGWNTELAQNNIANLVRGLGVDLYTHVIDWDEYRRLMQAFFEADVIDVELLYDNAMLAVNYQQAAKFGLRYILGGNNHATEGMLIPKAWNWYKLDRRNIVALARKFGRTELRTFPALGVLGYRNYEYIRRIRWVFFLDYLSYNRKEALGELEASFRYKRYPYKHYESVFTRFYQGYILPKKFGVDKRLLHLSTLIVSGQCQREEAIAGLTPIAYPSEEALEEDVVYFLKKMNWSRSELDAYLARPEVRHDAYRSEKWIADLSRHVPQRVKRWLRRKA